jgi:hypothetical protein
MDQYALTLLCSLLADRIRSQIQLVLSCFWGRLFCVLLPWIRLGTIFYLGYLAFEFPQNLALQIFSLNILIWGVAQCSHAACKNIAGLFVCRLVFEICEGSITAGFMIVSSMFYMWREHTARVGLLV